MKKIIYTSMCVLLMGTWIFVRTTKGKAESENAEPENKEVVLFDGSTFKGWRGYNRADMPKAWTIENHSLKINSKESDEDSEVWRQDRGDIIFNQKFEDFELSFEWKVSNGSKSGVYYMVQEYGGNEGSNIFAPKYEITDDALGAQNENYFSASIYDIVPSAGSNSKPCGEWNESKIIVKGGEVRHIQNGKALLDFDLTSGNWAKKLQSSDWAKKLETEQYSIILECGEKLEPGYIALQDKGKDVWYRNIKIKEI